MRSIFITINGMKSVVNNNVTGDSGSPLPNFLFAHASLGTKIYMMICKYAKQLGRTKIISIF